MAIINCTPHSIVLRHEDGTDTVFPPSGITPRLKVDTVVAPYTSIRAGVPTFKSLFGQVEGLPVQEQGTFLIVSTLVAQTVGQDRQDLIAPDTGPTAIREGGQVQAVIRFQTFGEIFCPVTA